MSNIWVPSRKLIIVEPKHEFKIGYAGFYKLDVLNPDKTLKKSTGWFPNLITNNGLDLLSSSLVLNTVCVGTGNTAPAFTDTALVAQVGATTNIVGGSETVQGSAPYYGTTNQEWQFPQGAAAGNLAEVGVGSASNNLLSRALILDGGGNPTTITVLPNEFLNVTYSLRMVVPTSDVVGSVLLSGVTYNYTIRASRAATASHNFGWLPRRFNPGFISNTQGVMTGSCIRVTNGTINESITGFPSGTSIQNGSGSSSAYVAGTFNRASTYTWGINEGNIGITAMEVQYGGYQPVGSAFQIGGRGSWQIGFDAPIPKDNTKQLTLNFNVAVARV
jgi:hypothetical protein